MNPKREASTCQGPSAKEAGPCGSIDPLPAVNLPDADVTF